MKQFNNTFTPIKSECQSEINENSENDWISYKIIDNSEIEIDVNCKDDTTKLNDITLSSEEYENSSIYWYDDEYCAIMLTNFIGKEQHGTLSGIMIEKYTLTFVKKYFFCDLC